MLFVYGAVLAVWVGVNGWNVQLDAQAPALFACVNPPSRAAQFVASADACQPGWTAIQLSAPESVVTGGPRVLDAANKNVGAFVGIESAGGDMLALRRVEPYWLVIPVTIDGFARRGVGIVFATTDCSGQSFIEAPEPQSIARTARRAGPQLHFSGDPIQVATFNSAKELFADGTESECYVDTASFRSGPHLTVDVASFGLTPPFRLTDSGQ